MIKCKFQIRKRDGIGFIVIPKKVWKLKGWQQSTELELSESRGDIIIREAR